MTWKKIGFYVVFALAVTVGVVLFSAPAYATESKETETYSWYTNLKDGVTEPVDANSVTWPQTLAGLGVVQPKCGEVIQVDTYKGTRAEIDAVVGDGILSGLPPEDSGILVPGSWYFLVGEACPEPVVKEHEESICTDIDQYETRTWTTVDGVTTEAAPSTRTLERTEAIELGCYTPPVLNCDEYQVPGWLNQFGDATSCVSNNPCPEVNAGEPCPSDVVPPVVTQEPAAELAETGVTETTLWALGIVSAVLVLFGTALLTGRRTV